MRPYLTKLLPFAAACLLAGCSAMEGVNVGVNVPIGGVVNVGANKTIGEQPSSGTTQPKPAPNMGGQDEEDEASN